MLEPLRAAFEPAAYSNVLVGLTQADDAAVYRLNDEQAVIATTDFFPPVVDDAYDFGAVAAANALSDIYAMGGTPLFAINLAAFPDTLDVSILSEILRGGAETMAGAGAVIIGGHTVNDPEPKYGLAVIGIIHPQQIIRKRGALAGDVLMLTKPLGVGVITTALKNSQASAAHVATAVASMKQLNREAARAAQAAGASAMTDVTGFGLLGHASEMVQAAAVDFVIDQDALPWLPGAIEYAQLGAFPGGMGNNSRHFSSWVEFDAAVDFLYRDLMFTPETSGGLLIAMPSDAEGVFAAEISGARRVGRVTEGTGRIKVTRSFD